MTNQKKPEENKSSHPCHFLVGMDIDYTLKHPEGEIPDNNKAAIRQAVESGFAVALISGRSMCNTLPYVQDVGVETACAADSGAVIFLPEGPVVLKSLVFNRQMCREALDASLKYPVDVYLHEPDKILHNPSTSTGIFHKLYGASCRYEEIPGLAYNYAGEPNKISFVGSDEVLKSMQKEMQERFPGITCYLTFAESLECIPPGASKGEALHWIADYMGLDKNRTAALGDSENDIEMFEAAGVGIAVGNAMERVKDLANVVAPDYDKDGAAWALRYLIEHFA
ncbi:MAG: HAD family hydrolase [Anaerolineaceae bacterium]|jgi:Cof subfamily protein (haloacid dehalogenase superfamily)